MGHAHLIGVGEGQDKAQLALHLLLARRVHLPAGITAGFFHGEQPLVPCVVHPIGHAGVSFTCALILPLGLGRRTHITFALDLQ